MITTTQTLEFTAQTAAEYQLLIDRMAAYVTALNPGEVLIQQTNQAGPKKVILKTQKVTPTELV